MATLAKMVTKTLDVGVKDTKIDLAATVKSYDLTDTKFIFNIISNQGLNIDLTGSTAMYIVEYVHNSQTYAIQGDVNIIGTDTLSFNLPEDLKGYSGTVLIGIYVKLTDGTKIDIKDIAVRIEPSIMDKDIDFSAKTYFKDFESIKAEVVLEGEKAKTNIKAVLPSVQAEISEIKTEIENLPDIPDLFVAYADSADGSVGFSKIKKNINYNAYLNSFHRYIGYSVKNSTNPSYYRWQVNPEWQRAQLEYEKASMIQDKLVNLIPNADFTQGLNRWFKSAGVNSLNINGDYLTIVKNEGQSGAIGVYTNASDYMTKGNKYYISADFRSTEGYYGVFLFDGQTINRPSDVDVSTFHKYSKLIVPDTDFTIRFYTFNNQTYDMRKPILYDLTSIFGKGNEPTLEEFERLLAINVNSPTIYSQSVSKAELNSNPINSILTTLSGENPSTTLGGTWTQLGTETKFSNTIYYWKRTN
ncbi:BppU family phage baseplate upper protein [Enterococcus cecorum]|uniref:BppU family phage baseplate upper protein n=1 Tax=Enterococcus cecorum TaxID=44008 RepID=UPI00064296D9|nr:BppU family phage baseplate upper protein [Enterococcus cecorum]KLO71330.1 hypothetical protein AA987_04265 [Enterococcus cecorum]CAI3423692.1 BppU family phage baseplate upper protein [Enterococcus cecorum]